MMTSPPDAHEEVRLLGRLLSSVYEYTEAACELAASFFEDQGKSPDPWVFPASVRYYLRERLMDPHAKLDGLRLEELANNGISLVYAERHLRMWKSDDGSLPLPGASGKRRYFLNQIQLSLFDTNSFLLATPQWNEVLTWVVNRDWRLEDLYLSCPESALPGMHPTVFWSVRLEHPGASEQLGIASPGPFTPSTAPGATLDDLPIEFDDAAPDRLKESDND